ncbi:hypothetical protein LIN78_01965 [Leeia sp. TBRC 13508]|uniref:Uncharacterized protein n=1 Tax=Leeia speluncae TaxID=2884804 RepID=A0ABS8D2V8_9NEIS|nr:hypothetical protein [Leeia speluncae]MCB6182321.1 hypothetical protein [Leeia speluncae]
MHPRIEQLTKELRNLVTVYASIGDGTLLSSSNGLSSPISIRQLNNLIIEIADQLEDIAPTEQTVSTEALDSITSQINTLLNFKNAGYFTNGNSQQASTSILLTIASWKKELAPLLGDVYLKPNFLPPKARARLINVNKKIDQIESNYSEIESKLNTINKAHDQAQSLPQDLEDFHTASADLNSLLSETRTQAKTAALLLEDAQSMQNRTKLLQKEAKEALEKANEALRTSVTSGLAASFNNRAEELTKTTRWIAGGLIVLLGGSAYYGHSTLIDVLTKITAPGITLQQLLMQLIVLAALIGGPIWISWLATLQINHRFRLAEDYAFKASVAMAYEGFRSEAKNVDEELTRQLFGSLLTRFDQEPLRLIEKQSYGSPIHAFMDLPVFKKAAALIPGFVEQWNEKFPKAKANSNNAKQKEFSSSVDDAKDTN